MGDNLIFAMQDIYADTGRAFVILIDEWDCLFREYKQDKGAQNILTLQTGQTWTAGTRLIMKDGSIINDTPFKRITNGIVKYGQDYYWAAGPETGAKIVSLWGSGEPNRAPISYAALNGTIADVQGQESCVMVRNTNIKTLNDIIEGNVPGNTDITAGGFFVEFGGYADGADPGQPDNTKKGETNVLVAPMDAEAVINGVKYAPLADDYFKITIGKTPLLQMHWIRHRQETQSRS